MTAEEAKRHQDQLAEDGWSLSNWYGTHCEKCCGVYPRMIGHIGSQDLCRYECEVCGKKTKAYDMPWQAEMAWNSGNFDTGDQLRLF